MIDHAKAVKDLLKAGVDCWMSKCTAEALDVINHHRTNIFMEESILIQHSGWRIKPFHLEHDAADPLGFLIGQGGERLLFVPDTAYVENRFDGVTIAAVECNHIAEKLSENILNGTVPVPVGKRIRRNHMSLNEVIALLKANDLSRCRRIYLLHLSDGNSDERRMVLEVQQATGIPTEAAI